MKYQYCGKQDSQSTVRREQIAALVKASHLWARPVQRIPLSGEPPGWKTILLRHWRRCSIHEAAGNYPIRSLINRRDYEPELGRSFTERENGVSLPKSMPALGIWPICLHRGELVKPVS